MAADEHTEKRQEEMRVTRIEGNSACRDGLECMWAAREVNPYDFTREKGPKRQ